MSGSTTAKLVAMADEYETMLSEEVGHMGPDATTEMLEACIMRFDAARSMGNRDEMMVMCAAMTSLTRSIASVFQRMEDRA